MFLTDDTTPVLLPTARGTDLLFDAARACRQCGGLRVWFRSVEGRSHSIHCALDEEDRRDV